MQRFKVLLVGSSNVGKTTYVNYLITGKFIEDHAPTLGVDVHPYIFNTNYGPIVFDFWDCAGKYEFRGCDNTYYINANAAIIMYTSEYNDCIELEEKVRGVCNYIPIIFCENKSYNDINNNNVIVIDIYNKTNINKPILSLARLLTGHNDLELL